MIAPANYELIASSLTRQSHLNYGMVSPSSTIQTPIREVFSDRKVSDSSLRRLRRDLPVRLLDGSTQMQENFILNSDLNLLGGMISPTTGQF